MSQETKRSFFLGGDRLDLEVQPAAQDITDLYVSAIHAEIRRPGGQGLFSLDRRDLTQRKATVFGLFAPRQNGRVLAAGLHTVIDGGDVQQIQGAIVDPGFRGAGLMKLLAAIARVDARRVGVRASSCVIRIYPDGTVNEPSLGTFVAVGLDPLPEFGRVKIEGTRHDRHLYATAEQDGTIRFVRLSGDERTFALAHAEIKKWGNDA